MAAAAAASSLCTSSGLLAAPIVVKPIIQSKLGDKFVVYYLLLWVRYEGHNTEQGVHFDMGARISFEYLALCVLRGGRATFPDWSLVCLTMNKIVMATEIKTGRQHLDSF